MMEGKVLKSTGSWYNVLGQDKKIYQCRVRGKLKLKGFKTTNPVSVGDQVELIIEDTKDGNKAIITRILPRKNYLIRKSVQKPTFGHIIASNVDQAILIVTLVYPRTSMGFIDRFLVSAEAFRIPQVLVFNKDDLLPEGLHDLRKEVIQIYENIGVKCLITSAITGEGFADFQSFLVGKTSLLSGHSGVGKSTLVNKLSLDINQKTTEVSDFAQKGVHTTTFAEMFQITNDTFIIDTPGIKELGLIDISEEELSDYFPEMRSLSGECKFNNCSHTHEPKCAIIEAALNGEIASSRYESYLSMLAGEDNRR